MEGAGAEPTPSSHQQTGTLTCFSEREVVFGVIHAQDRVVVGGRHTALGWGALVQGAVLRFPGDDMQRHGLVSVGHGPSVAWLLGASHTEVRDTVPMNGPRFDISSSSADGLLGRPASSLGPA